MVHHLVPRNALFSIERPTTECATTSTNVQKYSRTDFQRPILKSHRRVVQIITYAALDHPDTTVGCGYQLLRGCKQLKDSKDRELLNIT